MKLKELIETAKILQEHGLLEDWQEAELTTYASVEEPDAPITLAVPNFDTKQIWCVHLKSQVNK